MNPLFWKNSFRKYQQLATIHQLHQCQPNFIRGFLKNQYFYSKFWKNKHAPLNGHLLKIKFSKINHQHDGFLVYESKDRFFYCSLTCGFLIGAAILYYNFKEQKDDFVQMGIITIGALLFLSFFIYQIRLNQILKQIILDKSGDAIKIICYDFGGFSQAKFKKIKIEQINGINKSLILKSNYLQIRGRFGQLTQKCYFDENSIQQKQIFKEISEGRYIEVVR